MKIPVSYKPEACVCKDTTRGSICTCEVTDGDHVTGAAMLVASDGHCLVAVPVSVSEGETPSMLRGPVSGEALAHARKLAKASKLADADLKLSADHYTFANGSTMPRAERKSDESFPDWHQIVPAPELATPNSFKVAFNLALLVQVAEALGDKKGLVTLTISPESKDAQFHPGEVISPILVNLSHGDPREVGVLMPCCP